MKYLSLFVVFYLYSSIIKADDYVFAPFGMKTRQPPTNGAIRLLDVQMGIEAKQVCGYTDWTTAQLKLPKQLLSKTYWKNIGKNLEKQAIESVMEISGALPTMIACNMSATFCNVLQHSEAMAAAEIDLTWNTCNALEGVNNTVRYGDVALANCISKLTSEGTASSEARERCINGGEKSPTSDPSKAQKIANTSKEGNSFDADKFLDSLFPKKTHTQSGIDTTGKQYTRIIREQEMAYDLFPGIRLQGTAVVSRGGSFTPPIETFQDKNQNETKVYIITRVRQLNDRYIKRGMSASQALDQCVEDNLCEWSKNCKNGKGSCFWDFEAIVKNNKPLPPIALESSDPTTMPTFIVTPDQLVSLTALLNSHNETIGNTKLDAVADRLSSTISYFKANNILTGLQRKLTDGCAKPNAENLLNQEFCNKSQQRIKNELDFLREKQNTEENALRNQQLVADIVTQAQSFNSIDVTPVSSGTQKDGPAKVDWRK